MISIITSSRNQEQFAAYRSNIEATIGIPFELLHIENESGTRGLCTLYNELAARARYPLLLFLHEDVAFHTRSWGNILVGLLSDEAVGLVGVLGSDTLTLVPSGWAKQHRRFNIGSVIQTGTSSTSDSYELGAPQSVLSVDGVLLATRKDVWDKCRFDEETLKGFHGYDFDFSMQIVNAGYKVIVSRDLLLEHFSKGSFNTQWVQAVIALNRKWEDHLPATLNPDITKSEWIDLEYWQAVTIIGILRENNLSAKFGRYIVRRFLDAAPGQYRLAFKLLLSLFLK